MDQAADRSRPDARTAQQLRRVFGPAACPRDRPDPVAHPGRPQPAVPVPALPGMLPQAEGTPRGTAPVTGQHTADVLGEHGFSRRRDRRAAGARDGRQRGMTTARKKAVVVGALGVIGRYIVDKLLAEGDWQVVGLSRRPARNEPRYSHISVDLLDSQGRRPQAQWPERRHAHLLCRLPAQHRRGGRLCRQHRAQPRHAGEFGHRHRHGQIALQRVVLVTGTKYYGVHLGPLKTPMRETDPRHMPPDFYFDQIDWLTDYQRGKKLELDRASPANAVRLRAGHGHEHHAGDRRLCRDLQGTRPAVALPRQARRLRLDLPGDGVRRTSPAPPCGPRPNRARQPGLQHHQRRLFPLAQRVAEDRRCLRHEGGRGPDHQPHPAHGRQGRAVGAA